MSSQADRAALAALVARYAVAVDRRDGAELATLFTADATMVLPVALGGTGAATPVSDPAVLLKPLAQFESTRHTIAQQVADIDGSTATAVTYGEAHHLYRRGGELRDFAVALRYADEFRRTDDGWRISRRELLVDWIERRTLTDPHPVA